MKMQDTPLTQVGGFVSVAISNDEDHPASNVIDGNNHTFWVTTGLMPQSLTISFPQVMNVRNIKITCFKGIQLCSLFTCKSITLWIFIFNLLLVKNIVLEKSNRPQPTDFDVVDEKLGIIIFRYINQLAF